MRPPRQIILSVIGWSLFHAAVASPGDTVRWLPARDGQVPAGAIFAGHEANGQLLALCRARYNGGVHSGKVIGRYCNIGWGGAEVSIPEFEVATGQVDWIADHDGHVPSGAIIAGEDTPGRKVPVCRATYKGGVHLGKMVVNKCNFGWGGQEITSPSYEVAVFPGIAQSPTPSLPATRGAVAAKGPITGYGELDFPDGHYTGQLVNGVREGYGKLDFGSGDIYEGEWHSDRRQGEGKQTYRDGNIYEGGWADGEREGPGHVIKPNGTEVIGVWKHGKHIGESDTINPNGSVDRRMYDENGEFVGFIDDRPPDNHVMEIYQAALAQFQGAMGISSNDSSGGMRDLASVQDEVMANVKAAQEHADASRRAMEASRQAAMASARQQVTMPSQSGGANAVSAPQQTQAPPRQPASSSSSGSRLYLQASPTPVEKNVVPKNYALNYHPIFEHDVDQGIACYNLYQVPLGASSPGYGGKFVCLASERLPSGWSDAEQRRTCEQAKSRFDTSALRNRPEVVNVIPDHMFDCTCTITDANSPQGLSCAVVRAFKLIENDRTCKTGGCGVAK